MGYVHDTHMSQFIPPSEFQHSAGTWTISEASNLMKSARTAADAAFTTLIPIPFPPIRSPKKAHSSKASMFGMRSAQQQRMTSPQSNLKRSLLPRR